jgi:DNA helicase-2/ATP-dependent DNA helicase PcrA
VAGKLDKPWRWINADSEALGAWLLDVRERLVCGEPVDLREAPDAVTWIQLGGADDYQKRLRAAREQPPQNNDRILIIGDSISADKRHQIASRTPGAITVEAVELRDLISFSRNFDPAAPDALDHLVRFAQNVMINVGAAKLVQRVESLKRGTARKPPSGVERTALSFVETPSYSAARNLLAAINRDRGVRAHRPAVLKACLKAMLLCDGAEGLSFYEAAIAMREENRFVGRSLPRRAVGSTLLLKGLEAEVAVILNADDLDARNLYVAMTRGSKMLTICSRTPILNRH